MSETLKYIVQELNKEPFNKSYNLISFDSLEPMQLLQNLNDIIASVDQQHKIDIREESPDQTAIRIFEALRIFRYKPPTDASNLSAFRQGLVQGEKLVIYPIMEWLLQRSAELKKRAYLAKYLVKVQIPPEIGQDEEVANLYQQYEDLMETFKETHKQLDGIRANGMSTVEIKRDIAAMQDEKEQLGRRVERLRKKVESFPNSAPMLEIAKKLRAERDREIKLQKQMHEQRAQIASLSGRQQRIQQQVKDMRQSAVGATPEALLQRLEEETKVNNYMVMQKIPKELESKRKTVQDLQKVVNEPAMGHGDLDNLRQKIRDVNADMNQLIEKRMVSGDPMEDKLSLFRQQASIISRKKEGAAETLKEAREELVRCEGEMEEKSEVLRQTGGGGDGEMLKAEEFKKYVNKLRTKSTTYKGKRQVLSELKAEHGVLARTEELLRAKDEALNKQLGKAEARRGVAGYRETQEELEKVSEQMSGYNTFKGETLEDMSTLVQRLTLRINEKKNELAPIVKELRPLRQKAQDIQQEYDEKKASYDKTAAGIESNRSKLEQEVKAYKEEILAEESRYHYLQCMKRMLDVQQGRINDEMKSYVSGDQQERKKAVRELYNKKIQEQEHLGKSLREKQKSVRESHAPSMRQMGMWKDLERLVDCKLRCMDQDRERERRGGEYADVTRIEEDRLVL